MTDQTLDLDDLLETAENPWFIDGVFNYCNRRCEGCPLSDRCRLFADEQRDLQEHPDAAWTERVHRSFQRTFDMIRQWCAREGIDFETLRADSRSDEAAAEMRISDEPRQDPLQKLAEQYTFAALKLSEGLRRASLFNTWPAEAHEALETIEWFSIRVASKVHRALTGYVRRREEDGGIDPKQSDWNGSAKVVRLDIADSRAAWNVLLTAGHADADSPMREMIGLLDRIDVGVAERFPRAMDFVRPGFDEPALV